MRLHVTRKLFPGCYDNRLEGTVYWVQERQMLFINLAPGAA